MSIRFLSLLVKSALFNLGASSRVQPAPTKNNAISVFFNYLGAGILLQGAPLECNYTLESDQKDQKGGFFIPLVSLIASCKNEGVFPHNMHHLHPFLYKYLFLKVFMWVQVGCKQGCTMGALWVQAPKVVLTCTQFYQRKNRYIGQGVQGCTGKDGMSLKSGN